MVTPQKMPNVRPTNNLFIIYYSLIFIHLFIFIVTDFGVNVHACSLNTLPEAISYTLGLNNPLKLSTAH